VNDYFQEYLVFSAYSNDFFKMLIFRVLKILSKNSDLQNQNWRIKTESFTNSAQSLRIIKKKNEEDRSNSSCAIAATAKALLEKHDFEIIAFKVLR